MAVRVLQIVPRYAPAWKYGGTIRFPYDLNAALTERGFSLTVYTTDQIDEHRRSSSTRETINGIDVHRFRNPSNYVASKASWLGLWPLGLRARLHETLRQFDVVHVIESRGPHARWAFAAARTIGVPVVWSPLGTLAEGVGIRKPYRRVYDRVHSTSRLVREAYALVAQSPHEARVVEQMGASPAGVRLIGLGIDPRWFRELPARGQFREALGIAPSDPMVLFVGRFHPNKGLDVLLKASAILRRSHPQVRLVLIGWDHGALRTIRRLTRSLGLADAVTVLPPAFEIARIQAYLDADVFAVAATTHEETSLAALEAVATGTPCVLTRQCEIPGIEAMGGGLVTACHPEPFAAALRAVLEDPNHATRARFARRTILSMHTIQTRAAEYADLFREAAGAGVSRTRVVAAG